MSLQHSVLIVAHHICPDKPLQADPFLNRSISYSISGLQVCKRIRASLAGIAENRNCSMEYEKSPTKAVLRYVAPGRSAMALLRPLGAAMAEPNQVQCMHVGWDGQKIDIS